MREFEKKDIERCIIALLWAGPVLQKDIVAALPAKLYLVVGKVIRDMDARGLIRREKHKHTNIVALTEYGRN